MIHGQRIQRLRQNAGMTQLELAEKLFVSRDLIAKWETGARRPDYKTILNLSKLFGVDADEILSPDELLLRELTECIPEAQGADMDSQRLKDILNDFLHTVSNREASVFIRRYYHMDEPGEIAELYHMKTQNVYLTLSRLRKKLKKYISEALA